LHILPNSKAFFDFLYDTPFLHFLLLSLFCWDLDFHYYSRID